MRAVTSGASREPEQPVKDARRAVAADVSRSVLLHVHIPAAVPMFAPITAPSAAFSARWSMPDPGNAAAAWTWSSMYCTPAGHSPRPWAKKPLALSSKVLYEGECAAICSLPVVERLAL